MSLLWTPPDVEHVVPDWFRRSLADIDLGLIVYFNPIRQRWVIDRCTRDDKTLHAHTSECPRTNVLLVQTGGGHYMPLCEQVLEWFKKNDVGTKHASPEDFVRKLASEHEDHLAKLKAERVDNAEHNRKDHRVQLNQVATLVKRHDMRPNEIDRMKRFEKSERKKKQGAAARSAAITSKGETIQ